MAGVSLHGLDEVGDKVIALFELDIDVRPCALGSVPQTDELVVKEDSDNHEDDRRDDQNSYETHETSSAYSLDARVFGPQLEYNGIYAKNNSKSGEEAGDEARDVRCVPKPEGFGEAVDGHRRDEDDHRYDRDAPPFAGDKRYDAE